MSETLNSGEATAPAATKVPVEIPNVRPAPGQIALKHRAVRSRPSTSLTSIWLAAANF